MWGQRRVGRERFNHCREFGKLLQLLLPFACRNWPISDWANCGGAATSDQFGMRVRFSTDCVEKPGAGIAVGASLEAVRRLGPRLCGGWLREQLGHLAEVLGGAGE